MPSGLLATLYYLTILWILYCFIHADSNFLFVNVNPYKVLSVLRDNIASTARPLVFTSIKTIWDFYFEVEGLVAVSPVCFQTVVMFFLD